MTIPAALDHDAGGDWLLGGLVRAFAAHWWLWCALRAGAVLALGPVEVWGAVKRR